MTPTRVLRSTCHLRDHKAAAETTAEYSAILESEFDRSRTTNYTTCRSETAAMSDPGKDDFEQVNARFDSVEIDLLRRRYITARDNSAAMRMAVQDAIDDLPQEVIEEALEEAEE